VTVFGKLSVNISVNCEDGVARTQIRPLCPETCKKWEDNPNTYRYFFGAEADPVSEKEAAMWAVHLDTTLEDAYALLTD
jgi:hypothetical protein